jgi:hypothetical protein
MLLRDHPLMNYRGFKTWPPRWHARGDGTAPPVKGEIGVLTEVTIYNPTPQNRSSPQLFLFMEDHGHQYLAAILFTDAAFCLQIGRMLQQHYGRRLEEIGALELSGLL